jgi:hypothetical protein
MVSNILKECGALTFNTQAVQSLYCLAVNVNVSLSFRTLRTINPLTRQRITEDVKLHQHCCRKLKSYKCKGTRIVQADSGFNFDSESQHQLAVQADSGSDSDSESRRKEYPLFNNAGAYSAGRRHRVGADSLSQTVYRNDFLILVPTLGIRVGN